MDEQIIEGEMLTPLPRKQGESITMNFPDAMKQVIDGKKVAMISWANTDYVFLKDGWLTIFTKNEKDTKQEFHTFLVNDGDLLAEDWFVVKEEE